jgi:glycosyltransferase involved in cell wall biosynthesis
MSLGPAVELSGYLDSAVGVGEAARLYGDALQRAGVPVRRTVVTLSGRDGLSMAPDPAPEPSGAEIRFNLVCLNPEQLVPYLDARGNSADADRTTIGIWSWEVDVVPPGWREAAGRVAEIWTYSTFAADLIGEAVGRRVVAMPPPIPPIAPVSPLGFSLPSGFRVLTMFDYLSTLERKNPLGAIEAFRCAFDGSDNAVLVVKSVNGRHRPDQQAKLLEAVGERSDIVLIDETLEADQRDALVSACDCYLSLHRAEGHGLPLAEAMAAGKPVVATAYGGNAEFMSEVNSYLVDWVPALVGDGVEHYPNGARWAEPDPEHAAQMLRAIYEDPDEAGRRAALGQAGVRALLAPEIVGARMRARLQELDLGAHARSESNRRLRFKSSRRWRRRPSGEATG